MRRGGRFAGTYAGSRQARPRRRVSLRSQREAIADHERRAADERLERDVRERAAWQAEYLRRVLACDVASRKARRTGSVVDQSAYREAYEAMADFGEGRA